MWLTSAHLFGRFTKQAERKALQVDKGLLASETEVSTEGTASQPTNIVSDTLQLITFRASEAAAWCVCHGYPKLPKAALCLSR